MFIDSILCTRYFQIYYFILYIFFFPPELKIISAPLKSWGNWGSERLLGLPQVKQQIQTWDSLTSLPHSFLPLLWNSTVGSSIQSWGITHGMKSTLRAASHQVLFSKQQKWNVVVVKNPDKQVLHSHNFVSSSMNSKWLTKYGSDF
jgi:hypothetical protein